MWFWVMCWLGFIPAFLTVGISEYRIALAASSRVASYCLVLLIGTITLWILFFVSDHKARANVVERGERRRLVILFTVAGSILAVYTLAGVFFFVYVAPRVQ